MTTKPEGVVMWAVYGPDGALEADTIRASEGGSIDALISFLDTGDWHTKEWTEYFTRGYRCIRVTVQPEESRP